MRRLDRRRSGRGQTSNETGYGEGRSKLASHCFPLSFGDRDETPTSLKRRKLTRLEGWNARRRRLAEGLRTALEDAPVKLPGVVPDGHDHVYHQFVVRARDRDGLREHMAAAGIATGVHYPVPIHLTQAYAHLGMGHGTLSVAERLAQTVCSLPIFPSMTAAEVRLIARALGSWRRDERRAA